jgi:hypothetical protein
LYNAITIIASSDGTSILLKQETPNENKQPQQQRMATLRGLDIAKKNLHLQNVLAAIQQVSASSTTNWTEVAAAASECESHANETAIYLGFVIDAATLSDKNEVTLQTNQAAVSASAARLAANTAKRLASSGLTSDEVSGETTDGEDNDVISSLIKVDSGVSNFDTIITDAESAITTAKELEEAAASGVDAAMKADQSSNEQQNNSSSSTQDAQKKVNELVPLSISLLREITQLQHRMKFVLVAA